MANVQPLRGLRYSRAHSRAGVYAPPYDVIDPAMRRALLAADPYNVVGIDLGPKPDDPAWYAEAAATKRRWLGEGVLARDAQPAFYGYQQTFRVPTGETLVRTGLIGRVELRAWGDGVHPHERTRLGPRADRLALMRATGAQTSPVFGMYHDPRGDATRWLVPPSDPLLDFVDAEGVRQVFWAITDAQATQAITAALAEREIVIADGHHRYETALAYRTGRREAEGDPAGVQPYDYALMYLAAAEDPGLRILATHRVVSGPDESFGAGALLGGVQRHFDARRAEGAAPLHEAIAQSAGDGVAIGMCLPGGERWVLRLRAPEAALQAAEGHMAPDLALLDVAVLQNLILAPLLGLTAEVLAATERVSYTIHEDEACRAVTGGALAAFILNPTSMDQVWRTALHGVTMPQKSTYFYPKLLTGLVFNPLDA